VIWYKFHLGDYITHTTHLSDAEDLAYRRLLDLYYMSESPIPLDTTLVARKIRLDLDITESVLSEFFEITDEGYQNTRCDAEIAKYQHQVATNRSLGKRGGRPKKTESVTEPEPNTNPKKIKNKNKNRKKKESTPSLVSKFPRFSMWAGIVTGEYIGYIADILHGNEAECPKIDAIYPIIDNKTCGVINGHPRVDQWLCACTSYENQSFICRALNAADEAGLL
jgi:uncharacterized protein YdaU (DUF1376 family)